MSNISKIGVVGKVLVTIGIYVVVRRATCLGSLLLGWCYAKDMATNLKHIELFTHKPIQSLYKCGRAKTLGFS